jgi:hypothetical protein
MTPYLTFVLVLTIAYIFYYGYIITKDIIGKKEDTTKTEEVFDIESLTEEVTATPVKEVEGGFTLGEDIVNTTTTDTDSQHTPDNKCAHLQEQMEEADVQSEGGMTQDEMIEFMVEQDRFDSSSDAYRKSNINEKRQVL